MLLLLLQKDVSAGLAHVMAPKDESEMSVVKKACQATCDIYNKYLKQQIIDVIDAEKVIILASQDLTKLHFVFNRLYLELCLVV